jgi:hypothetical protein
MKAWEVSRNEYEPYATVVFAETRNKARYLALSTECCEDCDYGDIVATRLPQIDKYYTEGKTEMDWSNQKDRLALVKECGFICGEECDIDECYKCLAQDYCDQYLEFLEYHADENDEVKE